MIVPTIGRIVWYRPSQYDRNEALATPPSIIGQIDPDVPCRADVVYVHHDHLVNLSVTDHYGERHTRQQVTLWQEGEAPPAPTLAYCEWMPAQIKMQRQFEARAGATQGQVPGKLQGVEYDADPQERSQ